MPFNMLGFGIVHVGEQPASLALGPIPAVVFLVREAAAGQPLLVINQNKRPILKHSAKPSSRRVASLVMLSSVF